MSTCQGFKSSMTEATERPLRADALRNRGKIVTAARAAFAEKGVSAPLEEIARSVGVGQGTLYRHFPTRDELIAAAIRDEIIALKEIAASHHGENPVGELRQWLRDLALFSHTYSGLPDRVLDAAADEPGSFADHCRQLGCITADILARAQVQGQIREEVSGEDVFLLANAIAWSLQKGNDPSQLERHISILMRGIMDSA